MIILIKRYNATINFSIFRITLTNNKKTSFHIMNRGLYVYHPIIYLVRSCLRNMNTLKLCSFVYDRKRFSDNKQVC